MPSVAVSVVEFKFSRGFESYLRSHSTVGRAAPRFDGSGSDAADFTRMAKFCRVLHSFKAKFAILFSQVWNLWTQWQHLCRMGAIENFPGPRDGDCSDPAPRP